MMKKKPIHLYQISGGPSEYLKSFNNMEEVIKWSTDEITEAYDSCPKRYVPHSDYKKDIEFISWIAHQYQNSIFKTPKDLSEWDKFEKNNHGYMFVPIMMASADYEETLHYVTRKLR